MWRLRPHIVQGCLPYANLITRAARPFCPPHHLLTSARAAYLPGELRSERRSHWLDDGLIVNSPHIKQQVLEGTGRPSHKITVIPNAIPIDDFAASPDPDLRCHLFPDASFVVGVIGRIARQKDHPTLLHALHALEPHLPPGLVVFFLGAIGETAAQEKVDRLMADYHLGTVVKQLSVAHDVAPYYHASDVIALPSQYEGFPNVVLEAFAVGKPVIVSTDADAVGIVEHGITGWRFPTGDAAALADCIQEAWVMPREQLAAMGERARSVAAQYSVPAMVERYNRLYQSLIDHQGA
jgi:glycogen(starch) synthase